METSLPQAKLPFIPLSSLPYVVNHLPDFAYLSSAFMFGPRVKAEWISYDPNKITMLTANEMFVPMYPTPTILNYNKQTINVANSHELRQLLHMLSKPTIICVTRRQIDELGLLGFDSEFVIILKPKDIAVALLFKSIRTFVLDKLRRNKKFYLTIDLSKVLEEVTPDNHEEFVSWSNCAFHITNHSKPNPALSLDPLISCCLFSPLSLFASVPYKVYRKCSCIDLSIELNAKLALNYFELSPLILHFYNDKWQFCGRYKNDESKYYCHICSPSELESLLKLESCYRQ